MPIRTRSFAAAAIAVAMTAVVAQPAWSGRAHRTHARPVIELSPVAQRELSQRAPGGDSPAGMVLRVAVPTGSLELLGAPTFVVLDRRGHSQSYRAVVTGLQVLDTRAARRGWDLLVRPGSTGARGVELTASVTQIVATAATTHGLGARSRVALDDRRWSRLAWARAKTGNGAFAVTLEIDAVVPSARGAQVAVPLVLAAG